MNATSPEAPALIRWPTVLLLFCAVLALSIPQTALLPLLDRDEPRFAEASREMLQSGNYVVPTFNNAPRYAKPPLIYWCQTAAYRLFGENAFAARLPSLLATAATACLLYTWGVRLGSGQMGAGAGLMYAFCFQTIQQGRVATADALLIFFMTLTAFTGWLIIRPKAAAPPRGICFTVLTFGIAGGFLAKGPEALLPLLPLLWYTRGTPRGVVPWLIFSIVAGLALVMIWAVPAYIQTNGDYWKIGLSEGVGQRMVIGLQGHGASSIWGYLLGLFFYYPVCFLVGALPVWPLLVIHRQKLFRGWRFDFADTYLFLNAALIVLVFSLMVTKLPHYTLPAFPFLALLFARRWQAVGLSECALPRLGWITGAAFALLALVGVPTALAHHATPSPVGDLVHQAGDNLKPDTQFALVDFNEPNTIWEMRRVAAGFGQAIPVQQALPFLAQPGPRAVLLFTFPWQHLGIPPSSDLKVFQARGINAAKGSLIDLTLVVKP